MLINKNDQLAEIGLDENIFNILKLNKYLSFDNFTTNTIFLKYDNYDRAYHILKIEKIDEIEVEGRDNYKVVRYRTFISIENYEKNISKYNSQSEHIESFSDRVSLCKLVFSDAEDFKKWRDEYTPDEIIDEVEKISSQRPIESNTALVDISSSSFYKQQYNLVESQKNKIDELLISREYQLGVMRNKLESQKYHLERITTNLMRKLNTFENIIYTIEAFLKAKENLVQFNSGKKSDNPCLSLYQSLLYMDQEIGNPGEDSIEFSTVNVFFDWLKEPKNYNKILNEKSVTIFKIRQDKDYYYDPNPMINSRINEKNMNTYLVIRNGENLYYIDTGEEFSNLFPKSDFMLEINKEIEEANKKLADRQEHDQYAILDNENTMENIKNKMLKEQRKMLIIESLLQSTDIFGNEKTSEGKNISLLDPVAVDEGFVKFNDVHDIAINEKNRLILPEFLKKINEKITRGTRIVFYDYDGDYNKTRFAYKYEERHNGRDSWNRTSPSSDEIYNLDTCDDMPKGAIGFIMVKPEYLKVKLRFWVYATDKIINYDAWTLQDTDYYLDDRYVRRNYMKMMEPILTIRKHLIPEKENESNFIKYIGEWLKNEHAVSVSELAIMDSINWWKQKVIFKRPLTLDDQKAWRMITQRILNKITN